MAVFSVNQVRHLYVAKSYKDSKVAATDAAGTIRLNEVDGNLYFEYKGAGGLMRSDLINRSNILYVKKTPADKLATSLKTKKITLNTKVNGGALLVGQDYIVRIAIRQYIGMSDQDIYYKHGVVRVFKGMVASDFYKEMAKSLALNFARENTPLVTVGITTATTTKEVTASTDITKMSDTATGVYIKEVAQPWKLGVIEQVPVYFEVYTDEVDVDGASQNWGIVADVAPAAADNINNGRKIADLEYFCMGERADQYRNIGWPNVITTEYLVDPTNAYHVLDIHYAFTDSGINVQKSEKDITIVSTDMQILSKIYNKITKSEAEAPSASTTNPSGDAFDPMD